jgi:hypothetical protein
MKCNDLLTFMARHFSDDFKFDEKGSPRTWPSLKP